MIIYPLQAFGMGDVIFTQTLVRKLARLGDKILWGVESHFVDGLNRAYPDILFIDKSLINVDYNRRDDYVINGMRVLPIRWSDVNLKVPYTQCMSAKYESFGQKFETWRELAMWKRDAVKEDRLFQQLGLQGLEYTFVNRFFGSNSQFAAQINVKGVEMCTLPGYSLFDWIRVIENASEIHTVSSSIIYLLELIVVKAHEVHLYMRKPIEHNFDNVIYLLKNQNYKLHV